MDNSIRNDIMCLCFRPDETEVVFLSLFSLFLFFACVAVAPKQRSEASKADRNNECLSLKKIHRGCITTGQNEEGK